MQGQSHKHHWLSLGKASGHKIAHPSIKKSCNAATVQPPILGKTDVKCKKKTHRSPMTLFTVTSWIRTVHLDNNCATGSHLRLLLSFLCISFSSSGLGEDRRQTHGPVGASFASLAHARTSCLPTSYLRVPQLLLRVDGAGRCQRVSELCC